MEHKIRRSRLYQKHPRMFSQLLLPFNKIGHTMTIGTTRSGKTTLANLLVSTHDELTPADETR